MTGQTPRTTRRWRAGRTAEQQADDRARLHGWVGLAERDWRLFPVRPGSKIPAIADWTTRASSDPDRLRRFFRAHPQFNAGIACGPSGLLVIDCDLGQVDGGQPDIGDPGRPGGWDVLQQHAARHGGIPATFTVATPSGGRHLYFAAGGHGLGNTSRTLGPLLDTRGEGGQVLAPGSRLPGGVYQVIDSCEPARLPEWLADRLATVAPAPAAAPVAAGESVMVTAAGLVTAGPGGNVAGRRQAGWVAAAVGAELARVQRAGRGGHNAAVFTAANALGQLVGAGVLDREQVEGALVAAAAHITTGPCDCTAHGIAASIRSGLDRGARNPRRLPTHTANSTSSTSGRQPPPA